MARRPAISACDVVGFLHDDEAAGGGIGVVDLDAREGREVGGAVGEPLGRDDDEDAGKVHRGAPDSGRRPEWRDMPTIGDPGRQGAG